MSIPGMFRRGARGVADKDQPPAAPSSPSPPTKVSPRASVNRGSGSNATKPPENEELERSDLFGGSSRSPSTSPRASPKTSPKRRPSRGPFAAPAGQADEGAGSIFSAATGVPPAVASGTAQSAAAGVAAASSLPAPGPAARKEKRAFAGGVWGGGGGSGGSGVTVQPTTETSSKDEPVAVTDEAVPMASTTGQAGDSAASVSGGAETVPKPKAGGGKRRFAGGVFSGPTPAASQPVTQPTSDNPFGAGAGGGGGTRVIGEGRAGAVRGSTLGGEQAAALSGGRDAEQAVPAWAASTGVEESVPEWAASASASDAPSGGSSGKSNGLGLAPPSRADQGQRLAAEKSPFITVDPAAPAVRRPSQRRPGEAGSRRAFGGGERLF